MATSKAQRIGIIVIAVVMAVGTIGSFFIMILANQNQTADQAKQQEQYQEQLEQYEKEMAEMQKEQAKEAKKLSATYYDDFKKYESLPEPFDESKVKSLEKKDIVKGDGEVINKDVRYRAYYIGWNAEGKVFDGSIEGDALKYPIDGTTSLIEGWTKGVEGMRIGGVREISIPGDMAEGLTPSADIKKGAPLKFVIMAIEPADGE